MVEGVVAHNWALSVECVIVLLRKVRERRRYSAFAIATKSPYPASVDSSVYIYIRGRWETLSDHVLQSVYTLAFREIGKLWLYKTHVRHTPTSWITHSMLDLSVMLGSKDDSRPLRELHWTLADINVTCKKLACVLDNRTKLTIEQDQHSRS